VAWIGSSFHQFNSNYRLDPATNCDQSQAGDHCSRSDASFNAEQLTWSKGMI